MTPGAAGVAVMSNEPAGLRASHEDRDRVVDVLRVAAGDGRLSAEELDSRLECALSARTRPRNGRWSVPARIELRTQLCRVTFDFSHAVTTSDVLRIEADMAHGKLVLVGSSDILIDTDGLNLTYSKLKLRSKKSADDPRLRIELVGTLVHAKVIEKPR